MKLWVFTLYYPTGETNISAFTTLKKSQEVRHHLDLNGVPYTIAYIEVDTLGDWKL